ncbi:hypothetical protein O181_106208 [Austropuccinia psidii MF-1]|uniref:Uncharacterized protein n=1 Tax=Austropuccinia psidii MF-1 TaxID=1389203 RepID=A0A9Q3PLR1_9BASI|nr:hypothetical protein [Austropuccinia psidii MF-1]
MWFGTHLALRASGLPPLAPFGLIRLNQKGPDWPMDRGASTVDYGPWAIEAIGGISGPKRKIETWGLEIWKLAREANDGRIWPEAIEGQGKVIWPNGHGTLEGANWPQLVSG